MEPVRTCIGCGEKAPKRDLVRLFARDGRVAVDPARSGGRGAYLHAGDACLLRAAKRRAFVRAFRGAGEADPRLLRDVLTGNAGKD